MIACGNKKRELAVAAAAPLIRLGGEGVVRVAPSWPVVITTAMRPTHAFGTSPYSAVDTASVAGHVGERVTAMDCLEALLASGRIDMRNEADAMPKLGGDHLNFLIRRCVQLFASPFSQGFCC